jgi:hypothetical protein
MEEYCLWAQGFTLEFQTVKKANAPSLPPPLGTKRNIDEPQALYMSIKGK